MMTKDQGQAVAESRDEVAGGASKASPLPEDLQHLDERERAQDLDLRKRSAVQEYVLRQSYADWILRTLGAQLLIADAVFVAIAWVGRNWDLTPGMTEVWLAATVVQVVGVVAIVTRHLFPNRDGGEVSA